MTDPVVRRELILVFMLSLLTYSYFVQGGGHNQNATIAEIRELVEHGRLAIDRYVPITSDLSEYNGHFYSNKTPSVLFVTAPAYAVFYWTAALLPIDIEGAPFQLAAVQFITMIGSSLWGALAVVVIFGLLTELFDHVGTRARIWLALGIGQGSLLFPYATVLFVHAFQTFLVLLLYLLWLRWLRNPSKRATFRLGIVCGCVALANPLFVVVLAAVLVAVTVETRSVRQSAFAVLGALLGLLPLLLYDIVVFGNPLITNRRFDNSLEPGLLLGVFGLPEVGRLANVFGWGHRSLVPFEPYALLGVPALITMFRRNWRIVFVPVCVLAVELSMLLTFNGWHGGSAIGPRYMLPGLLLLCVLSVRYWVQWPRLWTGLLVIGVAVSLMTTSHDMFLGEIYPNPVLGHIVPGFLAGQLRYQGYPSFLGPHVAYYKFNAGHLLGLNGLASLLPLFAMQGVLVALLSARKAMRTASS